MSTKSELYGGDIAPSDESLFGFLEHGFLKNPDNLAVVSRSQPGDHLAEMVQTSTGSQPRRVNDPCLRWTYAEFLRVTVNLATGLSAQNLNPDSITVTLIPNSVEWLLLFSASIVAKTGMAYLDIDMLKEPRRAELEAKLVQLQPSCIVVADNTGALAVDAALKKVDLGDTLKISLEPSSPPVNGTAGCWRSFVSLCEQREATSLTKIIENARVDNPDRTALIIYTSGTSGGMPKGCVKHAGSLLAYSRQQRFFSLGDPKDSVRILQTANFRAIAPLISLMCWRDGSTVVLSTYPFHPRTFLDDIEQERVTDIALIPAQAHAIATEPTLKSRNLSSVRLVGSGGDMVTSSLIHVIERSFPQASFMTVHGMTECGGIFHWPYPRGSDNIPFYQDISSLGHVSPGARIRIMSATGEVVPRGEVGELHISHGSVFKSYLREQVGTPELYTDNTGQWFKTGDLGFVSDAGDVYIVGRSKDVIKRAGVSIAPAAIESCLEAYIGSQVSTLPFSNACEALTRNIDGDHRNTTCNTRTGTIRHR
jgi:acyl-coenzyme A synthetase/AMP-(fatty) acid ligase